MFGPDSDKTQLETNTTTSLADRLLWGSKLAPMDGGAVNSRKRRLDGTELELDELQGRRSRPAPGVEVEAGIELTR